MELEQFRREVASAVKEELGDKKWFRGVCMDGVNETYPNFKEAVELAIMQTSYWDDDDFLNGEDDE